MNLLNPDSVHLRYSRIIGLALSMWAILHPSGALATVVNADNTDPVLSIPLKIHVRGTGPPPRAWIRVVEEINRIWLSQARICFDTQITQSDEASTEGFDLWFLPDVDGMNGYYIGPHEMSVREEPDLQPVKMPARYPAARTAAHELGHALGLPHRQDSDENLMRSKPLDGN